MVSCNSPTFTASNDFSYFTIASTFEKPNSLKFELLFGDFQNKISPKDSGNNIIQTFDYIFSPNQIFGFAYWSKGSDYKHMHHAFVLRSCSPSERGSIIPGILPGAEILLKTLTSADSQKLKSILKKLTLNKVNLSLLLPNDFSHLNHLINYKNKVDYFVGEMIAKAKNN